MSLCSNRDETGRYGRTEHVILKVGGGLGRLSYSLVWWHSSQPPPPRFHLVCLHFLYVMENKLVFTHNSGLLLSTI